jgi:hypothetical protein
MTGNRPTVSIVATIQVPDFLPPAITRPSQLIEALLAQSLLEIGRQGRAACLGRALTGRPPSAVTLYAAKARPAVTRGDHSRSRRVAAQLRCTCWRADRFL